MKTSGKYNFISINKVLIKNFSLYSRENKVLTIEENINSGIYCLAGANGLGKTTFLNIINYGLTGIVLEPKREVFAPNQIISSNKDYTERYFNGRIKAVDKEAAEIELSFTVNEKNFRIIRGFSNRDKLRLLDIYELHEGKKIPVVKTENLSPSELKSVYEEWLAKEMGIGNFDYFIFYQLYVLTFDENRRTIFWDDKASTNTLSIAFNYDLRDAESILALKKEMDSLESYGRNARWQATQIKNEKEALLVSKKHKELTNWDELKKQYDMAFKEVEAKEIIYKNVEVEYDTLLRRQNIINSELLQQKIAYKNLFSLYSEPRSKLLDNRYIQFSQKENECFLCGSKGHYITDHILKKMHQNSCPVCDTTINESTNQDQNDLLIKLEKIDRDLNKKNEELENLIFESDAKKVEVEKAEFEYYSSKERLDKFEKENSSLRFDKTGDIPIDSLIKEYQNRFEEADKKAKDYYRQRDKLQPEYDNLIAKISSAYEDAETYFVPLFKKIAKSFIGLDLNIFPRKKGRDFTLNFELLGTARTESTQLSESQRFFLDIALRMALAVFLARENNAATLLIDTPEGSLDIAYESRVGKMFADFAIEYGQNVVMTANINASQLLFSLAEKCGSKYMQFRRMLDWTDLSEIQKEGEHLFEKVYTSIDNILKQN